MLEFQFHAWTHANQIVDDLSEQVKKSFQCLTVIVRPEKPKLTAKSSIELLFSICARGPVTQLINCKALFLRKSPSQVFHFLHSW